MHDSHRKELVPVGDTSCTSYGKCCLWHTYAILVLSQKSKAMSTDGKQPAKATIKLELHLKYEYFCDITCYVVSIKLNKS